ncbi:MAG: hypothetical protein KKA90_01710 [Nanoarchaeota archaeon]|nr:hypothetical protein [Nanoarchaeota archaeon]
MRGQIWSLDAIASILIFVSAFLLLAFAWNNAQVQLMERQTQLHLESRVIGISDSLLRTPGLPLDWNAGNVQSIGIIKEENVINQTLLIRFLDLPETIAKATFGISDAAYFFQLFDINGSIRYVNDQLAVSGTAPHQNATLIVPVVRFVLLDGDPVKLFLTLWVPRD